MAWRDDSGVALIEFALALPLLLLLLAGAVEFGRFALMHQKLDKAASAMADFAAGSQGVSAADLDGFAQSAPQIVSPFPFSGTVIFSSVASPGTPNSILWQHGALGGSASRIGSSGGTATFLSGYVVPDGEDVIAAEVFMDYAPLLPVTTTLIPSLSAQTLYKIAICKPRQGMLTALVP
ncbi:MAG: pilus assembly protein [Pseudomonadota bacterium]|nr:pilus assembly protein [Pseudomonadota bacterium]